MNTAAIRTSDSRLVKAVPRVKALGSVEWITSVRLRQQAFYLLRCGLRHVNAFARVGQGKRGEDDGDERDQQQRCPISPVPHAAHDPTKRRT